MALGFEQPNKAMHVTTQLDIILQQPGISLYGPRVVKVALLIILPGCDGALTGPTLQAVRRKFGAGTS